MMIIQSSPTRVFKKEISHAQASPRKKKGGREDNDDGEKQGTKEGSEKAHKQRVHCDFFFVFCFLLLLLYLSTLLESIARAGCLAHSAQMSVGHRQQAKVGVCVCVCMCACVGDEDDEK